jgi:pimeloyl-ACP methyl ester carboxylesterase
MHAAQYGALVWHAKPASPHLTSPRAPPLSCLLCSALHPRLCRCRIVAPDLRGHGLTEAEEEADLAAATLAADVVALWQTLFGGGSSGSGYSSGNGALLGSRQQPHQQQPEQGAEAAQPLPQPTAPPPTVLVGHSMGGAIAVHAAALAGGCCRRACPWPLACGRLGRCHSSTWAAALLACHLLS